MNIEQRLLSRLPHYSRYSQQKTEPLAADDPIYSYIAHRFVSSVLAHRGPLPRDPHREAPQLEVLRIEQIFNPRLQDLYLAEIQNIAGLCNRRVAPIDAGMPIDVGRSMSACRVESYQDVRVNEYLLFHGAKSEIIERLTLQGLDPRFAGENAGALFGQGSYLALNSSKSDLYTRPNAHGERCVLLVRACLGETHWAEQPMRGAMRPPDRPDGRGPLNSISAVTIVDGGCVEYPEFIAFDKGQTLPQFAIWYKHAPLCKCTHCCSNWVDVELIRVNDGAGVIRMETISQVAMHREAGMLSQLYEAARRALGFATSMPRLCAEDGTILSPASTFAASGRPTRVLVLTTFAMGFGWRSRDGESGHVPVAGIRLDFSVAELRRAMDPRNEWSRYVFLSPSSAGHNTWIVLDTGNDPAFPHHGWQACTVGMPHPRLRQSGFLLEEPGGPLSAGSKVHISLEPNLGSGSFALGASATMTWGELETAAKAYMSTTLDAAFLSHLLLRTPSGALCSTGAPLGSFISHLGRCTIRLLIGADLLRRIFIEDLNGRITTLDIQATDTISVVKQKFADASGIPVEQQRLIYLGGELEDARELADIRHLQNESTLHVVRRQARPRPAPAPMSNVPFSVTVTMEDGRSATVQALATTTILGLKQLISYSALGVPVAEQRLETTAGAGINWPGRSLRTCRIRDGAQLVLRRV